MSPIQSVEIRIPDRDVCWPSNTDPRFLSKQGCIRQCCLSQAQPALADASQIVR